MMPQDKTAPDRQLVVDSVQCLLGHILRDSSNFIESLPRPHHRRVVLWLPLALPHPRLSRLGRDGLVREHSNVHAPFSVEKVRRGDAARLDLLGADPAAVQALQPEVSKLDEITARGEALRAASLLLAVLNPFWHERHG